MGSESESGHSERLEGSKGHIRTESPRPHRTVDVTGYHQGRWGRARRRYDPFVLASLTVEAAVGGAFAGCHPTGSTIVDPLYGAVLAGLVTLASARARRSSLLILAAFAAGLSRDWVWVPGAGALALAFASAFQRTANRDFNALIGAVAVQAILRWPPVGFHGFTALIAAVAVTPVFVSRYRQMRTKAKWITAGSVAGGLVLAAVFSVPVVVGALMAKDSVDAGTGQAHQALEALSAGNAQSGIADLRSATATLAMAKKRTDVWWTLGGLVVPVVAQQRRALADATDAAQTLTKSASGEASALDFHALAYQDGHIDLNAVEALAPPLTSLDDQLIATQHTLSHTSSPWLVEPLTEKLDTFSQDIAKARSSVDVAALAAREAPGLLGATTPQRYFVVFMTPAETRGLGGLVGAYGILAADQGRLTLTQTGKVGDLNTALAAHPPVQLTGVAQFVARYGVFDPTAFFQDVTYSPDFPTVSKVISQMWAATGAPPVNGVIALDPETLASLLSYTGSITVPGAQPLTSANAADVLLRQQYIDFPGTVQAPRQDLLIAALGQAFEKLTSGTLPSPRDLASQLAPVAHQGRLLLWSPNASDESLFDRVDLGGAFPRASAGRDLLGVTLNNVANNKIDAYLTEKVQDHVVYDPGNGAATSTVTLTLNNGAPASGLPDEVIGSYPGSGLPTGTNQTWVSLYTPLQLQSATLDGRFEAFGSGSPELGVTAYSDFVSIPAQSTATITVTLSGTLKKGSSYQLTLWQQPLATGPTTTVSVAPSPGWRSAASATWAPTSVQVQTHAWRLERG